MIAVKCNDESFSYDIHSLIKAFYPAEDVKVADDDYDLHSDPGKPEYAVILCDDSIEIKCNGESVSGQVKADTADRPEYKSELKRLLYSALSKTTGRKLPWGTLTGIRPTKLAMGFIDQYDDEAGLRQKVADMYKNMYLATEEKAYLAVDIALRERKVLCDIASAGDGKTYKEILADGYSLYIGIPFCPSTCLYCSFASYPIAKYKDAVSGYLDSLKKEIDFVADSFPGRRLDSIYIGGGTPTSLSAGQLYDLIGYVKDRVDTDTIREFTVEAGRADSIDEEKLRVLKEMGVDRISVNPQTLNENTLKLIGRKATAAQTVEAYKLARKVGFDNINMDIILGLPGETLKDIEYTLKGIEELRPDDLTVHSLSVKRGSKLAELLMTKDTDMELINTRIDYAKAMHLTEETADRIGLKPYYLYRQKNISGNLENTGFAGEGKEGIYNILMMEEVQDIVACGAGTVSKKVTLMPDGNVKIDRCDDVKDINLYTEKITEMIDRKKKLFFEN